MGPNPDSGEGEEWRVLLSCRHSVQLRQNSHHLHVAKTDDQACRPGCDEVVKLEYRLQPIITTTDSFNYRLKPILQREESSLQLDFLTPVNIP